jgi:2,5-dihydroxypyridine 5,6-dioxygenase
MTASGVDNVLDCCLAVRSDEEVLLITDSGTDPRVIDLLSAGIARRGGVPLVAEMPPPPLPGSEPPVAIAAALRSCGAAIELTSLFIGSSRARQEATASGVRYLAMPGVVLDTFRAGGPLTIDFDEVRTMATAVGAAWQSGRRYRLTSPAGTDLVGNIDGRPGRVLDGIARSDGAYMAPPDIEAGTAPVEGTSRGIVVIDADFLFMGRGPVDEPVAIQIERGELADIEGSERHRLLRMIERCNDDRMVNLAEVSMGLNPLGSVCSVPMETESTLGTAHIAFGNSIAYGGIVNAVAHLDCVMRDATLEIDGVPVIAAGVLV